MHCLKRNTKEKASLFKKLFLYLAVFTFSIFGLQQHDARAINIGQISYTITDQSISAQSLHIFSFTNTAIINPGDDLYIEYDPLFDISTITSSDVTLEEGGVVVPVVDWTYSQVGSRIIIDFNTARTLGNDYDLFIGGANLIQNPSVISRYTMDVGDTSGRLFFAPVVVIQNSHIQVQAIVLGDPVTVGGTGTGGSSSGGSRKCPECFFDETNPPFSESGNYVVIEGIAQPNGAVDIFLDGKFVTTVQVNPDGTFRVVLDNVESGNQEILFQGTDSVGGITSDLSVEVELGSNGLVNVDTIKLSPTIYSDYAVYDPELGEIVLFGVTVPGELVGIFINGVLVGQSIAQSDGVYSVTISMDSYAPGTYEFSSRIEGEDGYIESITKIFEVRENTLGEVELNPFFDILVTSNVDSQRRQGYMLYLIMFITGLLLATLLRYLFFTRRMFFGGDKERIR